MAFFKNHEMHAGLKLYTLLICLCLQRQLLCALIAWIEQQQDPKLAVLTDCDQILKRIFVL